MGRLAAIHEQLTDVPGLLCLQGGREFTPDCVDMDRTVLALASTPVTAVVAGAARIGSDYDGAVSRARRHYEHLGATVVAVPDPRVDIDGALSALDDEVGLIVLPGGSPGGLLDVLIGAATAAVGERLLELHRAGVAISGASAGAMVMCSRLIRPDRGGDMVGGLALAGGLALPHWSPGPSRWQTPDDLMLWGLPECGGVIIDVDHVYAIGRGEPSVRRDGVWSTVPRRTG